MSDKHEMVTESEANLATHLAAFGVACLGVAAIVYALHKVVGPICP